MEDKKPVNFFTLKNPRDTLKQYSEQFKNFSTPMTAAQIQKKYHLSKSVYKDYIPRMRELALVLTIKRDEDTEKMLKLFYDINWGPREKYYFLTPKSSEIIIRLFEIFKDQEKYLDKDDNKNLMLLIQKLSINLKKYEFFLKNEEIISRIENENLSQLNLPKGYKNFKYSIIPIHNHQLVNGKLISKPVPFEKKHLENYSYFNIIKVKENDKQINLKTFIKNRKKRNKSIRIEKLNKGLSRAITKLIIIEKHNPESKKEEYYLPINPPFCNLQSNIHEVLFQIAAIFDKGIILSEKSDVKFT